MAADSEALHPAGEGKALAGLQPPRDEHPLPFPLVGVHYNAGSLKPRKGTWGLQMGIATYVDVLAAQFNAGIAPGRSPCGSSALRVRFMR